MGPVQRAKSQGEEARVEELYMGKERQTRQGWFELHVGGFGTRAESHC